MENVAWNNVAYGNGKYVAVGTDTSSFPPTNGYVSYSTDGNNWNILPNSFKPLSDICYDGSKFIAIEGGGDNLINYSIDGINNWYRVESRLPKGLNTEWTSICYGEEGKYIIATSLDNGFNGSCSYSNNGINWTAGKGYNGSLAGLRWIDTCYNNGYFYLVDGHSLYYSEDDGKNWSILINYNLSSNTEFTSICYGNGRYVIVSYRTSSVKYNIAYSLSDDINGSWNAINLEDIGFYRVRYGNGKFIAVGKGGKIATSSDGIVWESKKLTTNSDLYCVTQMV